DLGAEPEQFPPEARIGVAMADVPGAVLLHDLGLDLLAEPAGDHLGDLEDRGRSAGAEIEGAPVRTVTGESERAAPRDVADVDEVPRLAAVLEDERRAVVEDARREDGGDAGVGVRERLPLAVDVEEPEGDGRDPIG